ncbi:MAG: hypothetical protein ACMUHX_09905, partial [bacterium]
DAGQARKIKCCLIPPTAGEFILSVAEEFLVFKQFLCSGDFPARAALATFFRKWNPEGITNTV